MFLGTHFEICILSHFLLIMVLNPRVYYEIYMKMVTTSCEIKKNH